MQCRFLSQLKIGKFALRLSAVGEFQKITLNLSKHMLRISSWLRYATQI